MRIGYFGGSFDPVHLGHLLLAQDALERAQLDRIVFVPAAQAPLKKNGPPGASPKQRIAMLEAAIAGRPEFSAARDEIKRGGVSYTVDTIRALRKQHPGDDLYWIIGGDQAAQLADWRSIDEICRLATFLCLQRPGFDKIHPPGIPINALEWISGRQMDLSSTEIRERAANGKSLEFFLPPAVANYINNHSLYSQ
ncbi:MAG: nicotinate-nucleotide adenylyltransferase [Puniceicoccales bacterium]